jgi:hypothetical protein
MGTGTSACNCMRTIKPARVSSRQDSPLSTSCLEYSRCESLLRTRRHVHATYRATSRPRISLISRIAAVAGAGTESSLRTHHAPSLWTRPLPTNVHNVRGFFTSTANSQAVAADSGQQPEDTSQKLYSWYSSASETLIFEELRREGQFSLHIEEGQSQGRKFCDATLKIPGSDHEFKVWTRAQRRVSLFSLCILATKLRTEHVDTSGKSGTRSFPSLCRD